MAGTAKGEKAIMEEDEDEDNTPRRTLKGYEALLMTESEFIALSKGGERGELKTQFSNKKPDTPPMPKNTKQKEPQWVPSRPKRSRGINITGECEPTSSKAKVEDLVEDETNEKNRPEQRKKLWDRPVPPPEHQWYNWPQFITKTEDYRKPNTDEVLEPRKFTKMAQKLSLSTIDKSAEAIERLKKKYQNPIQMDRLAEMREQPSRKRIRGRDGTTSSKRFFREPQRDYPHSG